MNTKYSWHRDEDDGYEELRRPNGSVVAALTEPEDRCFGRDLSPVIEELNTLYDRAARLEEEIRLCSGSCRLDRVEGAP